MATVAPLNIAPSECNTTLATAEAFIWRSNTINMHVTRPKSAKGRTRSSLNYSHSVEAYSYRVPSSPQPAAPYEAASTQRASSTKPSYQPGQVSPDEIPELLQRVPLRTSSSLNKYRVLPSISRKGLGKSAVETVIEQTNKLKMSSRQEEEQPSKALPGEGKSTGVMTENEGARGECSKVQPPISEKKPLRKTREESSSSSVLNLEEPLKKEPRLLLAVRSPSGQRFEHHFRPTDSLQTVLAVAEQKNTTKYKCCSVETMEVPRRSFPDLTKSLQECGIPHKSVLCILQEEQDGDL
ncbi:UBX domain-containing protein 10 [Mauremys mutica]|uniref:UBX domain-containing protein n=1 Tax=Mauremys mutica TaxID=74926 RepID=A0A9D3X5W4_9SAUR|nr:UBX domain-containing protein 10 [Mauremys mutica]XP_044851905.1 UBX domain-containing protein 10 [Mauremys mutica]XP_044851906.1 UBX domain-containing protein 10 [Mauremys mutica]XP_044851907.1 UBX domain-containing protein 10 [Mauremys mutica]XP_044851908.1 UBX domain-containing protein 10 [Mauremys mutica]XP_044851909.1 UBX domain-containing protein 10 [Mauremys mutica]XP_044851910.1 UBX domain-containing protein 10 [Mauremys mutica]XP_044851911.1 UBX domain-containing protein 10 [Maur